MEWTLDSILQAMDANIHFQMTYLAKHVPTEDMILQSDVTVVRSPIPDDTFNYVLSARFNAHNAIERVRQVIALYSNPKVPFYWLVGPLDTPKNLSDILSKDKFICQEEYVGMYMELLQPIPQIDHKGLQFEQVLDQDQLKCFAEVIASAGESSKMYRELYSKVPPHLYQNEACFEIYIGYLGEMPVVTGILVLHANVAGIYYVATEPHHRKKGFATAMVVHLIKKAEQRGYLLATLQATKAGKHLYERLGFKECCIFKEYSFGG